MMGWLNYHHLQCFAAVVEEGGLVPAARRLRVSHPTVSEQIRKLESQLELELFTRRGRRLELTDAGRMVYGYAEQIFGTGAALLAATEARRSGRTVLGRVGVDSVLPKLTVRRLLSPVLDALGERVRLRCVEDEREALIEQLRRGQLDLVLSDAPAREGDGGVRSRRVARGGLGFFAAPSVVAKLTAPLPGGLDGAPFLLPMPTTRLRRELERWFGEHRIQPRVVAEIEDSGLIKALGQEGRGIFAMPAEVADEIQAQYGVVLVGSIDDIELRVFAIMGAGDDPFVAALLAAHGE